MRVARSIGVREVRLEEDPDPSAGEGEVVARVLA
jgi:L-iditol 2-dehydrogenase